VLDLRIDNARLYPMAGTTRPSSARSLGIRNGRVVALGTRDEARAVFDAKDRVVMPGLIDCHTHAVYAGDRMQEQALKLKGASYAEIARAGGGIASTVKAVRAASPGQLIEQSLPRITALGAEGVTTIEIKSGYGLDTPNELKMLEVIASLDEQVSQRLIPTFLGAHTVPPGVEREAYLHSLLADMLPQVAERRLAGCVDIFIDSVGFTIEEARRVFEAARELGLQVRAHAEQITYTGASALAAEYGALSCDHLEHLDLAGARAMATAGTIAVLLPGAFYFLRETRKPPLALLREHRIGIAVATDLNPGTSPIASLLSAMHLSVTLLGLTPDEALLGVTCYAAAALGRDDLGSLEPGRRADLTIWDVRDPAFLTYQMGGLRPAAVFIEGRPA
jgi:imidazolonepropionase